MSDELPEQDAAATATETEEKRLSLEVKVDEPSACERHITVTISREDVDRYLDGAYSDMMGSAFVPGFRVGHAPRKLVESRFRDDVSDQIKGSLLMDSMAQVNEDQGLSVISEPEIDVSGVEVPKEGPMTFEFDIEVRPEFDMPEWKGLKLERPTSDFGKEEVDQQLKTLLARHGKMVPTEEKAGLGDFVVVNFTVKDGDDVVSEAKEQSLCVRPVLSFHDGRIEDFGKKLKGAKAGDTKTAKITISEEAGSEALRGKKLDVEFEVLEVKQLELPEISGEVLESLGSFENEGELRDAIQDNLTRQLNYQQQQQARQQITSLLTEAASWELPPDLLKRQSARELQRAVMELQRSGFAPDDIRAHENDLRQNSQTNTARALREHFILERIAEDEEIEAGDADYDSEVELIAAQSNQSPRRVRAQLEKGGHWDALRNQIVERKVIDLVLEQAEFNDVPYQAPGEDVTAVDLAAGGGADGDIPEAQHSPAESLKEPGEHD